MTASVCPSNFSTSLNNKCNKMCLINLKDVSKKVAGNAEEVLWWC